MLRHNAGDPYSRIARADRARIVRLANNGGNWGDLAKHYGVKYKMAYTWIPNDAENLKPQIEHVVALV